MFEHRYFVEPDYDFDVNGFFYKNFRTYSEYNYSNNRLASYYKTMHFERALELTKEYFNKADVIDFGCADGCFLPSLSKNFNRVFGVDIDPTFIDTCQKLANKMKLSNVDVFCNKDKDIEELKSITGKKYDIIYCLEVIEHVGNRNEMYKSKIEFLNDIFDLIKNDGIVVISVPKMI